MKTLSEFIAESNEASQAAAKKGFDKLVAGAGTVGSHKGNVRVYYRHKGGTLKRTFVGDHDHHSYAAPSRYSGSGHYFAQHYSAREGHDVYSHVKLKKNHDLSDRKSLEDEIHKQNPHLKGTGHAASLAHDIVNYHGKKD